MTAPTPPLLAVVRSNPSGDGVGYVGLLLERALADIAGVPPTVIALDAANALRPSWREAASFVARLTRAQLRPHPYPVLFNHLGIARAQRMVPRPWRRPYAVFLHGVEIWDPTIDARRRRTVRGAVVRLSNSHFTAGRVMRVHPEVGRVEPCPLALLPDTPEPADADVRSASLLVGETCSRVVIVGRMSASERYKGHDELLDAWPHVVEKIPGASLFVVGGGDDAPRLAERARHLGIGERVIFAGFLPDGVMRALLRQADVFAMPSRGEGFGLAYLEAMRAGLPCVGSAADAARDVIVDGTTGFTVPVEADGRVAVGALAARLIALLGDRTLRQRMGAEAREREGREFAFGRFRERLRVALEQRMQPGTRGLPLAT